jgi:predicted acylesterase/phospholipase RssA
MAVQPQPGTLAAAPAAPDAARSLAPSDVRYIALEGGGGKGFAYLGAIGVLEELGVMQNVEGFAGASAGAITALLLSIGYTREKLERFLDDTDFTAFFDSPVRRAALRRRRPPRRRHEGGA